MLPGAGRSESGTVNHQVSNRFQTLDRPVESIQTAIQRPSRANTVCRGRMHVHLELASELKAQDVSLLKAGTEFRKFKHLRW